MWNQTNWYYSVRQLIPLHHFTILICQRELIEVATLDRWRTFDEDAWARLQESTLGATFQFQSRNRETAAQNGLRHNTDKNTQSESF